MSNPFKKGDRVKLCKPLDEAIASDSLAVAVEESKIYIVSDEVNLNSVYIRIDGWLLLYHNFELVPAISVGFSIDLDEDY